MKLTEFIQAHVLTTLYRQRRLRSCVNLPRLPSSWPFLFGVVGSVKNRDPDQLLVAIMKEDAFSIQVDSPSGSLRSLQTYVQDVRPFVVVQPHICARKLRDLSCQSKAPRNGLAFLIGLQRRHMISPRFTRRT